MRSRRVACNLAVAAVVGAAVAGAGCASETRVGATDQPPLVTELTQPPATTTTLSPEMAELLDGLLLYEAAATVEVGYSLATGFTVEVDRLSALNPTLTFRSGRPDVDAEVGVVWVSTIANSVICLAIHGPPGTFTSVKYAVTGPLPGQTVSAGPEPPGPCDDLPYGRLWEGSPEPRVNLCPARHLLLRLGAFDGPSSLAALGVFGLPGQVQVDELALVDLVLERSVSEVPVDLRDAWAYLRNRLAAARTAIVDGTFLEQRPVIFDDRYARAINDVATFVDGLPCLADDHLRPLPEVATPE